MGRRKRKKKKNANVYIDNVKLNEPLQKLKLNNRKSRRRKRKKTDANVLMNRMSLDDVQKLFVNEVGKPPDSVKQLLSFCQQKEIGWKFRDLNKWWPTRSSL